MISRSSGLKREGGRMSWFYRSFGVFCLFVFAAGVFYSKREAERNCKNAGRLVAASPYLVKWLEEAAREPFLYPYLKEGKMGEFVESYLRDAKRVSTRLSYPFLTFQDRALFQLPRVGLDSPHFREAVQKIAALEISSTCLEEAPRAQSLAEEAEKFWLENRARVSSDKAVFVSDQQVYCQTESLLGRLRRVMDAFHANCSNNVGSEKRSPSCAPSSIDSVTSEIRELEQQKIFNWNKLKKKWPDSLLAKIQCIS